MKRLILQFLGLLALASGARGEPPDILMIVVDDLRPMLGCYGDPRARTPNLDRLAERSVVFERAYCQLAKCGPSRLSAMTGLRPGSIAAYSHSTRELAEFRQRRSDAIPLPRWFKQQGYETRSFGKIDHDGWQQREDWSVPPFAGRDGEMLEIHNENDPTGPTLVADRDDCPVMQSPDVPDEHFFAGRMTAEVLRVLKEEEANRPRFLAVGFRRPHVPFVAPKRYFDLHQPDAGWLAANPQPAEASPVMAWFNSEPYRRRALAAGLRLPESPSRTDWISWNGGEVRSYNGVPVQGGIAEELQLQLLQAYAACVSYVDAQIGRLLDAVDLERTLVVLWSDHGYHLGEQGAWSKMTNFEVATRIPFMISIPGWKPGRTQALAELVDLYPTLCELAGVTPPPHLEGESLVPVLRDPAGHGGGTALSEFSRFRSAYHGRAMRTDRHRVVLWTENATGRIVERELYDHALDPNETRNLAESPDHAALMKKLQSQLEDAYQ